MPYVTEEAVTAARARMGLPPRGRVAMRTVPASAVYGPQPQGQLPAPLDRVWTLLEAMGAEVERDVRLFYWATVGTKAKALAGNDSQDVPIRVDPSAYFVAMHYVWRLSSGVNARNVVVNFIEGADYQLSRESIAHSALINNASGTRGKWPLPVEWVLRPGSAAVIRLGTRTAATATVDAHLSGIKVRMR